MERNKLQALTDTAAISAAHAVHLNGNHQVITNEAKKLLGKVYGAALPGITWSVQHPPQSGPFTGNTSAVAVIAERVQPVYFLSLFGVSDVKVGVRSVARVDKTAEACLLALSKDSDKAIENYRQFDGQFGLRHRIEFGVDQFGVLL